MRSAATGRREALFQSSPSLLVLVQSFQPLYGTPRKLLSRLPGQFRVPPAAELMADENFHFLASLLRVHFPEKQQADFQNKHMFLSHSGLGKIL